MNYDLLPIFSKPIFVTNLSISNEEKDKINVIIENENFKKSGIQQKNLTEKEASSSGQNIRIIEKDSLKFLKEKILKSFNVYKNEVMMFTNTNFDFTSSWITKTEENESSNFHTHSNAMFAGVYYHKVTENTSDLSFESYNNPNWLVVPNNYNIYNSRQISITPKNNDVIIFPSEVYHRIQKNNTSDLRYSIAFNLLPINIIGEGDSKIKLNFEVKN